jgi:anaerobic ribonucleoside-triphosphate reductase
MGCRSFLGVYEENGEQIHEGRNNIGVISLNLPPSSSALSRTPQAPSM